MIEPRTAATSALMDAFDALLFDLDGVVYVGDHAVPHAADAIRTARARGVPCQFVTNNASRSAQSVADHLVQIGIDATVADVVTSPQAAVSLLPGYVPAGSRVLVIGGAGIVEALSAKGYVPVSRLADQPAAVVQGFSPDLSWRDLAEATYAARTGLPWIATNPDLTFPTSRGVAPGNGAFVQVVAQTVGRQPDAVAGKPEPPLLLEAIARASAHRPLMIGDRLDTDVAAGSRISVPSLLVFTGVTTMRELLGAIEPERPRYLGADLRVLEHAYPDVIQTGLQARCRNATASIVGGRIEVGFDEDPWDAVRAVAALAWRCADDGTAPDHGAALDVLGAALA